MLVSKVEKAVFDVMPAVLKEHYTPEDPAKPEGLYLIQTDDAKELRNAKAREVAARQGAEALLVTAQAERDAANRALAQFKLDNPDKATAEAATQARIDAAVKASNDKVVAAEAAVAKTKEALKKTLVDITIKNLVSGLTAPEDQHLLEASIANRVQVDVTGDEPKITFLDDAGLATVETLDTFKKVIANDKKFAKIVIGSHADGGGAAGGAGQGGSGAGAGKKFADMNVTERTNLYRTNPSEFARLSAAYETEQRAASASKPQLIR